MSCQPRLTSLSYPWFYYQSSPLQGGQPTKANKPNPPGVSLVILCQKSAVALSYWLVTRGYHVEVEVTQSLHDVNLQTHISEGTQQYKEHIMLTLHQYALHYTIPHYITPFQITLHYSTLHYIKPFHITLFHITLHHSTLHYTIPHYITPFHITLH